MSDWHDSGCPWMIVSHDALLFPSRSRPCTGDARTTCDPGNQSPRNDLVRYDVIQTLSVSDQLTGKN